MQRQHHQQQPAAGGGGRQPTTDNNPPPQQQPTAPRVHAAVLENRAREVGIAVLDLDTATLTLDAFAEQGRSFAGLALALSSVAAAAAASSSPSHPPRLASVAVVDSAAAAYESAATGGVARAVAAAGHPLVPLPRCLWDDEEGFAAVCAVAALAQAATTPHGGAATAATTTHHGEGGEEEEEDLAAAASAAVHAHHRRSHYLAFGAAGALLQRAQRDLSVALAPRSLRVVYRPLTRQHTLLDPQTVEALELLPSVASTTSAGGGWWQQQQNQQRPRQNNNNPQNAPLSHQQQQPRFSSVYAFLNRTSTAAGARLLRTALLQPLTDPNSIALRHGALQALLSSPQNAAVADEAVSRLPRHLDRIVGRLAIRPPAGGGGGGAWASANAAAAARDPSRRVAAAVDAAVGLRALLQALPPLAAALRFAHSESPLLAAAGRALSDPRLAAVLERLEETLEEDAASVAAGAAAAGGGGAGDDDGVAGAAAPSLARSGGRTGGGASSSARGAFASRINVCFAVKAGGDGLLDVARATFCRLTEAVHALADGLRADLRRVASSAASSASSSSSSAQQISAAGFGVRYSARLGFYLQVPECIARPTPRAAAALAAACAAAGGGEGDAEGAGAGGEAPRPLPRFLVLNEQPRGGGGGARGGGARGGNNSRHQHQQQQQNNLLVWCTTHELNALNARLRDAASDCLLQAERALQRLLERHVLPAMPALLKAADAASLADLLLAMARAVGDSGGGRWVRPVMLPPPPPPSTPTAADDGANNPPAAPPSSSGVLVIKNGRHPLYERGAGEAAVAAADAGLGGRRQARYGGAGGGSAAPSYVPNDVAAAATSGSSSGGGGAASLHLVAGPNASGKTTYLRQVGVAAVLAQAGCFVPADACVMRPFDRIVARFSSSGGGEGGATGAEDGGDEDGDAAVEAAAAAVLGLGGAGGAISAGTGASHFVCEMRGLARALDAATSSAAGGSSLVLLDEPGRATGTADGTAIAWAAAERLLLASSAGSPSACVAFVATHYRGLEGLARCYPRRCRLWRMRVDVQQQGGSSSSSAAELRFAWRLEPASRSAAAALGADTQQQQQPPNTAALHYGVMLARATGALPEAVTARALEVAAALEERQRREEEDEGDDAGRGAHENGAASASALAAKQRQQRSHAVARALGHAAVGAVGEAAARGGGAMAGAAVGEAAARAGGLWRREVAALRREQ